MPFRRRDDDDWYTESPKSAPSGNPSVPGQQFTWLEMVWMTIVPVSYLLGYAIQISIVVDKYSQEERPVNCGLYILFLVLPHVMAGIKNLQYQYRETVEVGEGGALGSLISVIFLPFSPLIRFARAWRYGMNEKNNWEDGLRFVDEMVTVGVLRLFEVFLGDGPTLVLLARDDVWGRSQDWQEMIQGPSGALQCGPTCNLQPENPVTFWEVFRMLFLLSKMAQCMTFYLVVVKRLQRLEYPEQFTHLQSTSDKQGRLNFFATLTLYLAHFFFIGSRIMGYSMVSYTFGMWVFMIVGTRWFFNAGWHLVTIVNSDGLTASRSMSSLIIGGVWIMALTNEQGGRQLGRFIMFYSMAAVETAICGYMWSSAMAGSGDFFASKASWAMLTVFMMGLLAHIVYYSLCHPGSPRITRQGFQCCSGNRWDKIDDDSTA